MARGIPVFECADRAQSVLDRSQDKGSVVVFKIHFNYLFS